MSVEHGGSKQPEQGANEISRREFIGRSAGIGLLVLLGGKVIKSFLDGEGHKEAPKEAPTTPVVGTDEEYDFRRNSPYFIEDSQPTPYRPEPKTSPTPDK